MGLLFLVWRWNVFLVMWYITSEMMWLGLVGLPFLSMISLITLSSVSYSEDMWFL